MTAHSAVSITLSVSIAWSLSLSSFCLAQDETDKSSSPGLWQAPASVSSPTTSASASSPAITAPASPAAAAPATSATPASGADSSSKQKGIPDALKDLMPKDADASLAIPESHEQKAPGIKSKTSAAQSTAPHYVLRGRLEELAGRGARLPAGIVLNLRSQTAHMDPAAEKRIQGRVASFPTDWRGTWGGTLTVWTSQYDPSAFEFDAEAAREEQDTYHPGAQGTVSFNFFLQNSAVALQPATIIFPMRAAPGISRQMTEQLNQSGLGSLLGNGGANMVSAMVNASARMKMVLGDASGMDADGNPVVCTLIKNDLRQLKPGVMEQNIVQESSARHHQTGQIKRGYSEAVLRFTKLNSQQLYVQAASVEYGADGHFRNKVVLYGTVNRGVGEAYPAGSPFGAMPGAFPGMNPSGGGMNMNDLNNMLKQLQGL